jgi:hypothetical protein
LRRGSNTSRASTPTCCERGALWERCDANDNTFPCGADQRGDVRRRRRPRHRARVAPRIDVPVARRRHQRDCQHRQRVVAVHAADAGASKIATIANGATVAYGVAPVVCFATRPPRGRHGRHPVRQRGAPAVRPSPPSSASRACLARTPTAPRADRRPVSEDRRRRAEQAADHRRPVRPTSPATCRSSPIPTRAARRARVGVERAWTSTSTARPTPVTPTNSSATRKAATRRRSTSRRSAATTASATPTARRRR